MNILKKALSFSKLANITSAIERNPTLVRSYCDHHTTKYPSEKCINHVTLLGRVGIHPQLRGSESKSVAVFTLATNSFYKYDTGEMRQKTEWHKIAVFKPNLRTLVIEHMQKGQRVYIDGRVTYGEYVDDSGQSRTTTTIVANDIVFLNSGVNEAKTEEQEEHYVEKSS